jgi:hypothetical protein
VTPLGVPTASVPAIASVQDPLAWPALHVAVAADGNKIVASCCFNNDVGDLAPAFREVVGLAGDAVTLAPLQVNHQPGLAVGVVSHRRSTISTATLIPDPPFFTVQRSDPLGDPGVDLPRMATVDDELFLGYGNLSKEVVAACYIQACALDPSDSRINQDCDPDACPPDQRLVCALQPSCSIRWTPAMINNAMKGDLVLSPADGNGVIGTLLGALTPPQIYDHVSMMVENRRVRRARTALRTSGITPGCLWWSPRLRTACGPTTSPTAGRGSSTRPWRTPSIPDCAGRIMRIGPVRPHSTVHPWFP